MLLVTSNPALMVSETALSEAALSEAASSEEALSEATLSEAALSETTLSEAVLSEATLSKAALSEAVESAVQSVKNTAIFTARLWVSENALTYSAVCSSEFHSTFSCEFR